MVEGLDEFDRVIEKLDQLFGNLESDMQLAGEAAAEAIVATTLAGVADGDQPFAPYSAVYQKRIDAVGGKPHQVVDLRGLFYKRFARRKQYRSNAARVRERADRAAGRAIHSTGNVRAQDVTRPSLGILDPRSEMSVDLIHVDPTDSGLELRYSPREVEYMIRHNNGDEKMPRRPWFSLNKTAVKAAIQKTLELCWKERIRRFKE